MTPSTLQEENEDATVDAIVCGDLHHNACDQVLVDEWSYCPRCGSAAVGLSLVEIGQTELPDGGVRVKVEARPVLPIPLGGVVEVIGDGAPDRPFVNLLLPSFFGVDIPPESSGVAARVRVQGATREPGGDPFVLAQDLLASLTLTPRRAAETRVEAFPSLLCLAPGAVGRVEVHTDGRPSRLGHVQTGPGLTVATEGTVVRQNEPAVARITASGLVNESMVTFFDDAGRTLASTLVVPRPSAPMRSRSRFLVGIDFGTSGTSVWRSDALSKLPPESLLSEDRPPTAVFVDRPSVRSTWRYGAAALAAKRERPSGFLATEFKRYLQEEDDTVPEIGVAASDLLSWYLRRLLDDGVRDRLAAAAGGNLSEGDVAWRITMPVYDGGERSSLYRARMLAAARDAGLEDLGDVELVLEPECALRSLVRAGAFQRAEVPMGSRVMVVDGGGGTTDVAIGTLASRGDSLSLEDVVAYEVSLPLARAAGRSAGTDFGGGDVTRLAGAFAIASYARKGDPDVRYTQLARRLGLQGRGASAFGFGQESFFPSEANDATWDRIAPGMYDAVERVKRDLAENADFDAYDVLDVGDVPLTLARADVQDAIGEFLTEYKLAILRAVERETESGRAVPVAYALVGGNHILIGPEVSLPSRIRRVEVSPQTIRTAVVAGAALPSPSHAPPSPIPVLVRIDPGDGAVELLSYDGTVFVERVTRSHTYVGGTAGTMRIEAFAEHGGPRLLRRFSVPYEPGTVSVSAELGHGMLRIRVAAASDSGTPSPAQTLEIRL